MGPGEGEWEGHWVGNQLCVLQLIWLGPAFLYVGEEEERTGTYKVSQAPRSY